MALLVLALSGCKAASFDADSAITVVSREDGSGTRGAFAAMFALEDENGVDTITVEALVSNSNNAIMTTVAGNETAIGYVSMCALHDSVKAVAIDGVKPTPENAASGAYRAVRPFNIVCTKDGEALSDAAKDFLSFVMSDDGQATVRASGYVPVVSAGNYAASAEEGKVVVAGSSSVAPLMEKLVEAYETVNPNVKVELQTSDSGTGIQNALAGICDIGMASRELKGSEAGVSAVAIAYDGIAVVVNPLNPLSGLSSQTVRAIFSGETTEWSGVSGE